MICASGRKIEKNHIELLCKTRYYETVNELIFIYEDIGDRVYSICNDNSDIDISVKFVSIVKKYYKMGMAVQKRMKMTVQLVCLIMHL